MPEFLNQAAKWLLSQSRDVAASGRVFLANHRGQQHTIGKSPITGFTAAESTFLLRSFPSTVGMGLALLVAWNIRWKHLISFLFNRPYQPRRLPFRKVEATKEDAAQGKAKSVVVVLLHGMWNDASYFAEWQEFLADGGYTSYAIELLPGERWLPGGLLRQELVRDLEHTLRSIPHPYILMGHSRGGIVLQGALDCSPTTRRNSVGAILLASYPLGYVPSLQMLWDQRKRGIFHRIGGSLSILLLGKLWSRTYTKRIFLLPNTNGMSPKIARYLYNSVHAPADGVLYCCWHPQPPPMPDIPALIVGAEHDVLVPPLLVQDEFRERFPNSSQVIIPHQAHAFRDRGWELSMVEPLMDWLDCQVALLEHAKIGNPTAKGGGGWSVRTLEDHKEFDSQ